jgi:urease accessory protein
LTRAHARDGAVDAATGARPLTAGWEAWLALAFERVASRTVMTRREHRGPLVVQKPLYPEGADVCQCVIVHPPAGIVGGDRLALEVAAGPGARVQLTTPGAAKWYRSAGPRAAQTLRARVDDEAVLEWLPQGAIVFDGAHAVSTSRIELARSAVFIGAEVASLGRRAAGERFRCGEWRQRVEIVRDGAPIWSERAVLTGESTLLATPAGLNGASVFGTIVAVGPQIDGTPLPALRAIGPAQGDAAVTRLPELIVARYLGDSMDAASAYFVALWSALRPALVGRAAVRPRIWNT